ncbi:MAG: DUF4253 domain-containing protein [Winogradskyella sp.]|uniref:DUF4253 domain-containing protein n=1 Tax=Winogradskyella sp. TaxID=1883156 RepID=UPI000F3B45A4|nr:DUF4253 domain-containing protein [Winogradskyella sp.]RNC86909.1 MAG: DUF4253 domain-containing protein [Winogradskyella sp.]
MKRIFQFLFVLLFASCINKVESKVNVASSFNPIELDKNELNIDANLLSDIKSDIKKKPIKLNREVWNYDKDGNEEHYFLNKGLVFKYVNEKKAHSVFNKYIDEVVKGNNYIFLTNMDFNESFTSTYYDVIIIDGADPFDIIKRIGTNGINYDIYNSDVIKTLKEWNDEVNFKFVVIDVSRIHAYMDKLPKNIKAFSKKVYAFCPDVIDQGYSSMDEMILDYKENKYFWLWWD